MTDITRRMAGKLLLLTGVATWMEGEAPTTFGQVYPGEWMGQWIWTPGEADPFHSFVMARQSFRLEAKPVEAKLNITASDRYMLFLNGEYLGRGPARSDPFRKSYDTYDVGSHLSPGENVIAILAYHYGCANNYTRAERAGLFVQANLKAETGKQVVVGTDGDWRVRPAEAWVRDVKLVNQSVGVTEVYDANRDPDGWMTPGYDDSNWSKAYVVPERESPWSYLEARQTPMMQEAEAFPTALARYGEVESIDPLGNDVPERLAAESHFSSEYVKIDAPEAILSRGAKPVVVGDNQASLHAARAPFLIVDFGEPVFGFPKIVIEAPANLVVEMTYGPTLVGGRVLGLMQGVHYGDRYITRAGKQTWQVHEYKQFRYLEVVIRNTGIPVTIDSISVVRYNYPAERRGSFACSDQTLTKLWNACVDTTYVHMEDMLICDAVRERRGWTGDGGHGLYGVFAGYGDIALNARYFRLMARGQLADGMLRMYYPGTEREVGKTEQVASTNPVNIPQFALFYPMFLGEHYQYFGDLDLVKSLYPSLVRLARWCKEHSDEAGLLYNLPNWNFVDWVPTDMQGANFETNALYCKMLTEMSTFATDLGRSQDAQDWKREAEALKNLLRTQHWNPQRELYVDSVFEGTQSDTVTEVANGMALLWDIATPDQQTKILGRLADPHAEIVRATPLYFYYVLEGLAKAGALDLALEQMAQRYSPMMESSNSPTIWEDWNLYQHHGTLFGSQVHSGGVGPAWTLSKHVLGVYPLSPGMKKCRIEPKTTKTTWARGVFPSTRGDLRVEYKKDAKQLTLDIVLPGGVEAKCVLPRNANTNLTFVHNGKQYQVGPQSKSSGVLSITEKSLTVSVVGGEHHLELVMRESEPRI